MSVLDEIILGIHDGHDAAAALIHKGRVLCAVSEERLQRIKSTGGFPINAINACLDYCGLSTKDIDRVAFAGTRAVPVNMAGTLATFSIEDYVAIQEKVRFPKFYENRKVTLSSIFPGYKPKGDIGYPFEKVGLRENWEMSSEEQASIAQFRHDFAAETLGLDRSKVHFLDHHTCHAYYAYYAAASRTDPVLALTMDAGGDGLYESVGLFSERGAYERLNASHECIIGPLYTYVTLLLNLRPFEHEYKVMGLAPYAKEYTKRRAREALLKYMTLDEITFTRNKEVRDLYFHTKEQLKYDRFDGICGALQDFAEIFIEQWVKNAIQKTGVPDIVFSGGVSLNVKANKRISELSEVTSFMVPPAAGDESLPIGASWALLDQLNPDGGHREAIQPLENAYLGPDFGEEEIDAFEAHPAVKGRYARIEGDPDDQVSSALVESKIIGICRGRMEFGPRSLGHRSIIANASDPEAIRKINDSIKGRDFWMPFAPSILAETVNDYCHVPGNVELGYMTVCVDTTDQAKHDIAAALHPYDHTARPHVVSQESSPSYHRLLKAFKEKSGLGGVLNTSLNIHGKPIVMSPLDIANELLSEEEVDIPCLLIEDRFYEKM